MRSKIVAGNWKMNKNSKETAELLSQLRSKLPDTMLRLWWHQHL